VTGRYWIETLGCPKNEVDSAKLAGMLAAGGYEPAARPDAADLVVVNTCAFIEPARAESIETILALSAVRREGSRLVVTGCMAERYGDELARELPEVDQVAGFGVPIRFGPARTRSGVPPRGAPPRGAPSGVPRAAAEVAAQPWPGGGFDLLELPRPAAGAPWAYVKIAEGCDRNCGFCAIPSFRGKQRSRTIESILAEVDATEAREIVLVAQDLGSYGRDRSAVARAGAGVGTGVGARQQPSGAGAPIVDLVHAVAERVERVRVLYLYPSALTGPLIDAIIATGVPYFDLSLQHASGRLLRAMRRVGDGERFLQKIARIRRLAPEAAFRSSFILGYPGESEEDHDELLSFLEEAELDWAGFFLYSEEPGTLAAGLGGKVPVALAAERHAECSELQDRITTRRRSLLVGSTIEVMVDSSGVARSHREAPEIDGIVRVPAALRVGSTHLVTVTGAAGPDLEAEPAAAADLEAEPAAAAALEADPAVPLLASSWRGAVREAS
jgi:ribosomal protein S12 methylthiotransferase